MTKLIGGQVMCILYICIGVAYIDLHKMLQSFLCCLTFILLQIANFKTNYNIFILANTFYEKVFQCAYHTLLLMRRNGVI